MGLPIGSHVTVPLVRVAPMPSVPIALLTLVSLKRRDHVCLELSQHSLSHITPAKLNPLHGTGVQAIAQFMVLQRRLSTTFPLSACSFVAGLAPIL